MKSFEFEIKDYPNYRMNSDGEIVNILTGKVRKPVKHCTGYNVVTLCNHNGTKTLRYHRVAPETLIPNPENKEIVNHIDGVKTNNHPSNLEWCTAKENREHAVRMGLMSDGIGANNPACRYTREDGALMLEMVLSGAKLQDVTSHFKCNPTSVTRLINIEFPGKLPKYNGNWATRLETVNN